VGVRRLTDPSLRIAGWCDGLGAPAREHEDG